MPVLAATLVTAALGAAAASPPALPARVTSLEGVTEYRLDNGLRVLLIPDASQATVTVNLTVFAGSEHEDYGETGAAHLLEHLAFKGSPDFENVPGALNEHGASWNGSTWTDRTNYFETMPASDENLEFGIHFEAARLNRCHIRKSDLDSEMTVVRNEFEAGENSPTNVLIERLVAGAYLFHGYGHSTIGARSDIEQVPIERLQAFYRKWYQPDNALFIVAGRFDENRALAGIARHFGPIPRPSAAPLRPYTVEPPQDGERSVVLRRVGEVGAAGVVYHIPGAAHPDAAVVDVIGQILAATPSGRLYRSLVETKKAVSVDHYPFLWRAPGLLLLVASVRKDGSLEAVRDELVSVAEGLGRAEPPAEEVERARNAILKEKTLVFARSERLAVEMSEWAGMGDWRLFFVHRDRVAKVTGKDVQRVAAAYLRTNNRTSGLYVPTDAPERVEIPATPGVDRMVAEYVAGAAQADLAAETVALEARVLEPRIRRSAVGGLRLALLPKKTRGAAVSGRLLLTVGNEVDLASRMETNEYVADMLSRGTARRTRAQIKDELDRRKAEVRIAGTPNATNVTFTTTRENLAGVLDLIYEMLREPAFDAGELELLRQEQLAALEEASREPQALASIAFQSHLHPRGHVNHVPTIPEQVATVKGLTVEQLKAHHRDFYGAGEGWLAIVGDFDADSIEKLTTERMSGFASLKPARRIDARVPPATRVKVESIECPDKENALTMAGKTFAVRRSDPDYPALRVANYLIGEEQLNSRLAARLRQKDGLCYGAGSFLRADLRGDSALFGFYAISAPQNAEAVEKGFREELARARDEAFDPAEVKRAQESMLKELDVFLSRDSGLAAEIVDEMVRGETTEWIEKFRAGVRGATAAQVSAAVKKYLDVTGMALFRAGDFARAAKASLKSPAPGGSGSGSTRNP